MIKVKALSKSFEDIKAVNNISFDIKKGEIFGLLGPNGAGKSTTLNMLSHLLEPDSGEVRIDGVNLFENKNSCKMVIGVVPQEISLYGNLSAYDNLMFWGSLYGLSASALKPKVEEVLNLVGLSDRKNDFIKTYSGGMKRRINIASAILHEPKILLMDEPTVGVDPQSRNYIFEIIENLNKYGMTIVYTTHYMEEAERLCDTIAIIDQGTIVEKGTLDELRTRSEVKDFLTIKASFLGIDTLNQLRKKFTVHLNGNGVTFKLECGNINEDISTIINILQKEGVSIKTINTATANLETIFLKLTGKQLRD